MSSVDSRAVAAIVVVTNRGADAVIRSCLESLVAAGGPPIEVVVVDNSTGPRVSPDGYGPGVVDVVRVDNRGFGAAANAGFVRVLDGGASAVPVALLNDDIEVDPGWLQPLLDALDSDPRLGAVQPALLRHGGERINSLGVRLDRFAAGSDIAIDQPVGSLGGPSPIEVFTGGAVLFRAAFLLDTGGFDERYFLYYEDVDLALRGAERGWSYRCETASTVRHHGGSTTGTMGDRLVVYQGRNRLWAAARFSPPMTCLRAVWLSVRRLRHEPRRAHARGLASGLAGMPAALLRRLRARRVS